MRKVLITGATGLIGTNLTEQLIKNGYSVHRLIRKGSSTFNDSFYPSFFWNPENGEIDKKAFEGVSVIVHLAGAGIADKRWTAERKREIVDSRVKSASLLYKYLKENDTEVKTFINASAVGYYGDCSDKWVTEEKGPGKGFLADVCVKWEKYPLLMPELGIREVRCRIGIVLANNGGALSELTKTIPLGFTGYFSKSDLFYPWIHIDDVSGIIIHAIERNELKGVFNTTAPQPLLMKQLMQEILKVRKSKAILLPVPPFSLRFAMGEMSEILLQSQRCSAKKILESGYLFKYDKIGKALKNLYTNN